MKRLLAVASAALIALSACGGDDDEPEAAGDSSPTGGAEGTQEITFLVFESPNLTPEYWDAAIKRVTDKHPEISVEKLVSPTQDRTTYANQLLTSGQFPDVMIAVSPAGFAEAGELYAWTPEELEPFLFPMNGAVDGEVYQLPANTQTIPVVYYNQDMFADAGISEPPTTYDELLSAADALVAAGHKPFTIAGGHDSLGPLFAGILATEVYAQNPDWMHERRAGTVSFCDPEFTAGSQKLADLAANGYIDQADVSRDYAAGQQAFLDGDGAMYAMGNWFAAALDNQDTAPAFEVGQFTFPSDDGSLVVPAFTGGGLLVSASAENLEAARTFALEFQLDEDNLDNSARFDGLFPAIEGYTPPSDVGAAYQEGYDLYLQGVEADAIVPAFGFEAGDDAMLPGMVEHWDSSAVDLVTGNRSVQEVCEFLDAEWEAAS